MSACEKHSITTHLDKDYSHGCGLPKLPELIFFDTNIVQNLQSFGEFIYDNSLTPCMESKLSAKGEMFVEDIHALAEFMALGQRSGWPIAISPRTLNELEATRSPKKRSALTIWGKELSYYFTSHFEESQDVTEGSSSVEHNHLTFHQRQYFSDLLKCLPDESDRHLIIDALEYGCDIFLTMDYKTVWRHRDEVIRFRIRVMRPAELLEYIRPWAGLLM